MSNVIRIKTKEDTVLKIPFVDEEGNIVLEFEFQKDDNSLQRLTDATNDSMARLAKAQSKLDNGEDYSHTSLSKDLIQIIDNLVGEGSGQQLYDKTPSQEIMLYYFVEICRVIASNVQGNTTDLEKAISKFVVK